MPEDGAGFKDTSRCSYRKRQDADADSFHILKGIGAGGGGGAGGQHIIHEQDVFPRKALGMKEAEDTVHIVPPLDGRLTGLGVGMLAADDRRHIQGNAGHGDNSTGNAFALVVPAQLLLPGMQGDGDDDIYIPEETGIQQFGCHKAPHHVSQVLPTAIFQQMHDAGEVASFVIKEIRSGALKRKFPPEHTFHRIIFAAMIVGAGHVHIAFYADAFLAIQQKPAAYGALVGKN